jgi:hypothetical protein
VPELVVVAASLNTTAKEEQRGTEEEALERKYAESSLYLFKDHKSCRKLEW